MSISNFLTHSLSQGGVRNIKTWAVWMAPALAIPSIRYCFDERKDRVALLARDAATYTVGAGLFLASEEGLLRLFNKLNRFQAGPVREFAALTGALILNFLFAGIAAPKVMQWVSRWQQHHNNATTPIGNTLLAAQPSESVASLGRPSLKAFLGFKPVLSGELANTVPKFQAATADTTFSAWRQPLSGQTFPAFRPAFSVFRPDRSTMMPSSPVFYLPYTPRA